MAQRAIRDGSVLVNGSVATKASHQVLPGDAIVVTGAPPPYVSRGGLKLAHALDEFGLDVAGASCLDIGSSTGGFTDCLLQRGAASVVAVDVGTHQLHERLRGDARIDLREQTDIRRVDLADLGAPFDLVVCDVSFIGLAQVIDVIVAALGDRGQAVVLIKPQFEAGRAEASRGKGVISDPAIWRRVLDEARDTIGSSGAMVAAAAVSPITGGAGNVEFLYLIGPGDALVAPVSDAALAALVEEATGLG